MEWMQWIMHVTVFIPDGGRQPPCEQGTSSWQTIEAGVILYGKHAKFPDQLMPFVVPVHQVTRKGRHGGAVLRGQGIIRVKAAAVGFAARLLDRTSGRR
jgi:hypothetical protein